MSEPQRAIDTALFDPDTAASDDFYRHVNGGWLDANPVPSEYGSWGAPQIVHARNQEVLHQLLEDAAARTEPRGSAGQMVGDYFAAAMDEAAIAAAGVKPLGAVPGAHRRRRVRRRRPRHRARAAALRRRVRSTRSASRPTSRTRTPTSSTSARAVWDCPSATTTRATTSSRRRSATQYVAHVANQLGNLGDAAASARTRPPSASSPSRRAWPRRPTPPSSCATCSSR